MRRKGPKKFTCQVRLTPRSLDWQRLGYRNSECRNANTELVKPLKHAKTLMHENAHRGPPPAAPQSFRPYFVRTVISFSCGSAVPRVKEGTQNLHLRACVLEASIVDQHAQTILALPQETVCLDLKKGCCMLKAARELLRRHHSIAEHCNQPKHHETS